MYSSQNLWEKFFFVTKKERAKASIFNFYERKSNFSRKYFFTDESAFNLSSYFGRNNKVRICKRTEKRLRNGDEKALAIVKKDFFKKTMG